MLRRLSVVAFTLLLVAPSASAFSASHDNVAIKYDANHAPLVLAAGALHANGTARLGVAAGLLTESRIGPIPHLTVAQQSQGKPDIKDLHDVTVIVHNGSLVWTLENDSTLGLRADVDYGFGLGLPQSPFDRTNDSTGTTTHSPGLVLASPVVRSTLTWPGGPASLVPLRASISILTPDGKVVDGFDHKSVNEDLDASRAKANGDGLILRGEGAFTAALQGKVLIAALGANDASLALDVRASGTDRFLDAIDAMQGATTMFANGGAGAGAGAGAGGDSPFGGGPNSPFRQLEAISGILNGAILLLPPGNGDGGPGAGPGAGAGAGSNSSDPVPIEAKLSGEEMGQSPFTMLRSKDLALSWGDGRMGIAGQSTVAVTKSGFHVSAPLLVGPLPLLSLVLWLVAIGAVVYFFVKRPPASKGKWSLRGVSWLVYLAVLLAVFYFWDRSFQDTFGTSVISLLQAKGFSAQTYTQLSLVLGLELIPWTFAAALFALPVRIALGVALRYRGDGSSYKGIAKAGGLVSLAIFGPLYALWIVNELLAQVLKYAPKLFGGG